MRQQCLSAFRSRLRVKFATPSIASKDRNQSEIDRTIIKKNAALSLVGILCAGCSVTLGVRGQATEGSETFTGKATGYLDGGGTLEITSSKGRTFTGTFVYVTKRDGEGTFNCSDGSSGPFRFVSTGTRGTGSSNLSGKQFTFTFG